MVPADQEHRVVNAGSKHHGGHQHDRLVGDAQPQRAQACDYSLSRQQRNTNSDQRQQHGQHVAVDHQQNHQQHDDGDDLNGDLVALADVVKVVEGARRPGGVGLQRRPGDRVLHGPYGALGRGDRFRGGQFSDDIDRQQPRFVVLAYQNLAEWRHGDEVLQRRDVLGLAAQLTGQSAIDLLVCRCQAVLVGQHDQQDVF